MELIDVDRFEKLVADAIDALPEDILDLLDNVVILIDDEHPDEPLFGLYEGIPHTERDVYGGFELPDRITLYRIPLCEHSDDLEMLEDEVLVTVVHELAHHFGIDDARLHDLGWG